MIKFRAWEDRWKEYIKDVLIGSNGEIYFDDGVATQDDLDISIEQFTSLKDMNGKDIYEGDIVHIITEDGYERTGKVIFEKGCYMVDNGMDKYPINRIGFELDTLEVVGNAHANPELIDFYNMKQLGDLTT